MGTPQHVPPWHRARLPPRRRHLCTSSCVLSAVWRGTPASSTTSISVARAPSVCPSLLSSFHLMSLNHHAFVCGRGHAVCCIFHKRHVFGEDSGSSSSSDSSSSSSSSSSGDEDETSDGTHHHCCEEGRKHRKHKRRMNAYERQPRYVQALQEQLKREKELQQQQRQ